jgi:RHS repeat-associated protein
VRDVTDNSGVLKDTIFYDGFGKTLSQSNSTYTGRYTFTGREYDTQTGLQYNRARWYDPGSGRWITQDPLGFDAGDSNLYRYVANEPTIYDDSNGQYYFTIADYSSRNIYSKVILHLTVSFIFVNSQYKGMNLPTNGGHPVKSV